MIKKQFSITVLLICIFIGVLLSILVFNTNKISGNINNIITPKVINDYKTEKDNQIKKTKELEQTIDELQKKLENYGLDNTDFETVEKELYNELQKYDIIMGKVDLNGPGIQIIMSDSTEEISALENPNDYIIHNQDVLEVINELRSAGAEVIAINGYQLSWSSNIDCAGPVIYIDDFIAGSPFRIDAIGDQERMIATVESLDSYIEYLKYRTVNVTISKKDNIILRKK
ncbi:MAG: DUF881 domain-containing protein [Eubacteriales bacterium]